jgi:uncharacterized protein involved in exopolysaccharide biosynthesis
MTNMDERPPVEPREDEIDLGKYFAILRKEWWKIVLFSLAIGLVTLIGMFQLPNIYQSTAVITPSVDEKKQIPALGAFASFGVTIGGPTSVEDLESLFKSNDLTARVFRNHALWPIVLGDRFDPKAGTARPTWIDRLSGRGEGPKSPVDWDAIRAAKDALKVVTNRKSGVVAISFESRFAEGSTSIINYYLEEGKSRLQEEALDRAMKNKKFIQEQIGKTVDALTRDRLFALYGQEVEREMMARNREQFGFRVIDFPREPDRKSRPRRAIITVLVTIISMFIFSILMFFIEMKRKSELAQVT